MPRIVVIVSAILLALPGLVRADDICTLRPDLCGGKIKKKRVRKHEGRCRHPRDHRQKTEHLPVCTEAALAAQEMYSREMAADARFGSKEEREGIPDERYAGKTRKTDIDIDRYVNLNAGHPSLSRRMDSQQAFIEQKRPVTYGFGSGTGGSTALQDGGDDADKKEAAPNGDGGRQPASSETNR